MLGGGGGGGPQLLYAVSPDTPCPIHVLRLINKVEKAESGRFGRVFELWLEPRASPRVQLLGTDQNRPGTLKTSNNRARRALRLALYALTLVRARKR